MWCLKAYIWLFKGSTISTSAFTIDVSLGQSFMFNYTLGILKTQSNARKTVMEQCQVADARTSLQAVKLHHPKSHTSFRESGIKTTQILKHSVYS